MKGILILFSCAVLSTVVFCQENQQIVAYQKLTPWDLRLNNERFQLEKLIGEFLNASHHYALLSMTMFHSEKALLGISSLAQNLADNKIELADTVLNYMVARKATKKTSIYLMTVDTSASHILEYDKSAEQALLLLFHLENKLFQYIQVVLDNCEDTHVQHMLTHTVMDAQLDQLARINVLYHKMKNRGEDIVYTFEFDRYVNFYYKNVIVNPSEFFK